MENTPTAKEENTEKKPFDPQNNQYYIRVKQDLKQAIYIAKLYLRKYEEVEIHSLGEAMNLNVKVAETLERNKVIKILSVQNFQVVLGEEEEKQRKKLKMVIKVKRISEM